MSESVSATSVSIGEAAISVLSPSIETVSATGVSIGEAALSVSRIPTTLTLTVTPL